MHGIRLARAILDDAALEDVAITFVTGAIRDGRSPVPASAPSVSHSERATSTRPSSVLRWRAAGGSPIAERRSALARLEHIFLVGA